MLSVGWVCACVRGGLVLVNVSTVKTLFEITFSKKKKKNYMYSESAISNSVFFAKNFCVKSAVLNSVFLGKKN